MTKKKFKEFILLTFSVCVVKYMQDNKQMSTIFSSTIVTYLLKIYYDARIESIDSNWYTSTSILWLEGRCCPFFPQSHIILLSQGTVPLYTLFI